MTSLHPGITAVVVDEVDLEVVEVEAGDEEVSKPIRTRYSGHVTGYRPIRDQRFLARSVPVESRYLLILSVPRLYLPVVKLS